MSQPRRPRPLRRDHAWPRTAPAPGTAAVDAHLTDLISPAAFAQGRVPTPGLAQAYFGAAGDGRCGADNCLAPGAGRERGGPADEPRTIIQRGHLMNRRARRSP